MATYNKRGYKAPKPKEVEENVENEFEEVVETGDSTTAEVFNTLDETANKAEDWVAKNQKVILPDLAAGCSMADMATALPMVSLRLKVKPIRCLPITGRIPFMEEKKAISM